MTSSFPLQPPYKKEQRHQSQKNGQWPKKNQAITPPPLPQPKPPPWLHPNLLSMLLQQKKGRIKGPPKIADSTGKGTKTSLHKERRIFSIVSVKGNKSRIIIDQSLRHPTSRLSTKSINHANHQAWLRLLWNLASTSNYLPTTRYASKKKRAIQWPHPQVSQDAAAK